METYQFSRDRKYVKAHIQDGSGRSAVAFRDPRDGTWLEAASWVKPSHRLSMIQDRLEKEYQASRVVEDLEIFELGVHEGYAS